METQNNNHECEYCHRECGFRYHVDVQPYDRFPEYLNICASCAKTYYDLLESYQKHGELTQ